MVTKREKSKNLKVDAPLVFWVIVALFLASLSLAVYGFLQPKKPQVPGQENIVVEERHEEESLGQLFEEEFASGEAQEGEDEFSVNDPFKEICAQNQAGSASVVGGTVCLR